MHKFGLIKSNLLSCLCDVNFFIKGTVRPMFLLFNRRAKLHQFVWNWLVCRFQNVDQTSAVSATVLYSVKRHRLRPGLSFVVLGK